MPKVRNEVKMNLFIWEENFLTDYTSGIAFAIAPNVEDARRQLATNNPWAESELNAAKPKIYPVTRRVCRLLPGGS